MATSFTDNARLAAMAVNHAGRAAVKVALQSPVSRWMAGVPTAYHLLILPQDLRTGDPSFAVELQEGFFGLAGSTAPIGSESPFKVIPPTVAWHRELYAFSWLRHLHAADDNIARERARNLVTDWMTLGRRAAPISHETDTVARRAIALLSHAAFLLDGADPDFYDAVMRALSRDLHNLTVIYSDGTGVSKLRALTAVLLAGLCVAEQEQYLTSYLPVFKAELDRQILPDGGHVSRDPSALIELLLDFLPLKQCFVARQIEPPEALYAAVNRMHPMLRFLRLGDSNIARFNGMGPTLVDQVSTVFAYDDVFAEMKVIATANSNYARLKSGSVTVVADGGGPPALSQSIRAHAGCASFEMSVGHEPLISNCGAPPDETSDWYVVSRSTAAHSTLAINDLSSARLVKTQSGVRNSEKFLLSGPRSVKVEAAEMDNSTNVRIVHDGYRERFGLLHKRRLTLRRTGLELEGQDQLVAAGEGEGLNTTDAQFAIRFHLHPRVSATLSRNTNVVTMTTLGGQVWRFSAEGAEIDMEDSIFFADPICLRRTLQIVLKGRVSPSVSVVWRIERAAAKAQAMENDQRLSPGF